MKLHRLGRLALAALASSFVLTGCSAGIADTAQTELSIQPARTAHPAAQNAKRVMLAGDSILVGLEPMIEDYFYERDDVALLPFSRVATGLATPGFYDWNRSLKKFIRDFDPDVVVTNIGTNDYSVPKDPNWQWPDSYAHVLEQFIATATSRGAKLIWISPPVMGRKNVSEGLSKVNPLIRRLCRKHGVTYVNVTRDLADRRGAYTRTRVVDGKEVTLRFKDGIHVNRPGNEILMKKIAPAIEKALAAR